MIQECGRFVNATEQKRRAPLLLPSRFRHLLASAFVVSAEYYVVAGRGPQIPLSMSEMLNRYEEGWFLALH